MRNNSGEQLSNLFDDVLSRANLKTSSKNNSFIHVVRWDSVSDERTKAHTDGVFYLEDNNKRILIVYVDNPVWVAEFNMDKMLYLTRIKLKYSTDWIDDIHFKVSSRTHKQKKQEQLQQKQVQEVQAKDIVLSSRELDEIQLMCSNITNKKLRSQIISSMTAYKKWSHQQNEIN